MRSQADEDRVQRASPGIKDRRKIGAHLGTSFLHSSGPPFGALVVGSMESIYHIVRDHTEGLKVVLFDVFSKRQASS